MGVTGRQKFYKNMMRIVSAFATIKHLTGLVLGVLFMRWWLVKIRSILEAIEFGISDGSTTKKEAVNKAILEWDPIYEPKYFDDASSDLCSKLLSKDPKKDLGHLVVKK